jgi:hypothetical protein
MALEYFNPPHEIESGLRNYVRSHQYSISFAYSSDSDLITALEEPEVGTGSGAIEWICKITVRGQGEKLGEAEEIAEIVGRGVNKIIARRQ